MNIYYDSDAKLDNLKSKKIAILGYGSQGHAHALNLKESGMDVIIAEVKGGEAWDRAKSAGCFFSDETSTRAPACISSIFRPDSLP